MCSPKSRPLFKIREEVVRDPLFQEKIKAAMEEWVEVQKEGLSTLTWWEIMVKPGIRRIAMERSKEINQEKRSQLNLLLLRQTYLVRKVQQSQHQQWGLMLAELTTVQQQIQSWYRKASKKN